MLDIMKSIYDMMGKYTYPSMQDDAPREHVESFFQVRVTSRLDIDTSVLIFILLLWKKLNWKTNLQKRHLSLTLFFLLLTFFQKMDRNKDGVVTVEEFIESCKKVIFMIYINISLCLVKDNKSLQLNAQLKG